MNIYERMEVLEKRVAEISAQTTKAFLSVGLIIKKIEKRLDISA